MITNNILVRSVLLICIAVLGSFIAGEASATSSCCAWKKIVSREIEIGEKIDLEKYVEGKTRKDITLAKMMVDALRTNKVTGYSNFDMTLSTKLSAYEYRDVLGQRVDTQEIEDPITGKVIRKYIRRDFDYSSFVHTYRILEEWSFDPRQFKTEIRILGIAPVRDVYGDDGVLRGVQAAFWLHYSDVLPIIKKYEQLHPDSTVDWLIGSDYFSPGINRVIINDVRQAQVIRMIDMPKDKDDTYNHHLKNRVAESELLDVLVSAKYAGKLTTWDIYDGVFSHQLKNYVFSNPEIVKTDTLSLADPTSTLGLPLLTRNRFDKGAHKINIVENWAFNIATGITTISIQGIAPLIEVEGKPKTQTMFWVKYEDIKDMVYEYDSYHSNGSFAGSLWDNNFFCDAKPVVIK